MNMCSAVIKRALPFVLFGFMLAGCASMAAGPTSRFPSTLPRRVRLTSVPFYAQKKYQCGPAALAMALQWSGGRKGPDELVPAVYTPGRKGSLQSGLITGARRNRRLAYPIKDEAQLFQEVAAGRPVVVLQNLGLDWIPKWHYAVVVGFDLGHQYVELHSGQTPYHRVGLRRFIHTWQRAERWGLLVLPADQMPLNPKEDLYLNAALGLQSAGHLDAALQAYAKAVDHWPNSAAARIALGNAAYQSGAVHKALQAYSEAVRVDPENGDALNNLAHLLAESGQLQEAETMVRRAIAAGGPHMHLYQKTLEEIRSLQR